MNETALKTSDKPRKMPGDSDEQMESSGTEINWSGSADEGEESIITVEKVAPVPKLVGVPPSPIRPPRVLPKIVEVEPSEFVTIDRVNPSAVPLSEHEVMAMQRAHPVVSASVSKKSLEIMRVSRPDLEVEPKLIVRKIHVDMELVSKRGETGEKVPTPEVVEPEPSLDVFDDLGVDKERWIMSGSTGLPSDAQLFYIHGKEGAGFDVFKGLLTLEIMDRGRRPKRVSISLSIKGERNIENISDDKDDYHRLIWIEDSQIQNMRDPKIADEISKALHKGFLKYIVFVEQGGKASTDFKELENVSMKHGIFSVIRLMRDPTDELLEVGEVSAKILQINRRDIPIKEMLSGLNRPSTIDATWVWLWNEKNSALKTLQSKYAADPEIRQSLPPSSRLDNESDEHFVMKQLAVKEILDMGSGGWRVEELYGKNCKDCQSWEEQEIPDEQHPQKISIESLKFRIDERGKKTPVKRPDITFRTEKGKYIWIEVETCKNSNDPLDAVMGKLRPLTEVEESERPDEIWIVFPYRKYFLYGAKRFERDIYSFFTEFRRKNDIGKFKPRIFFADLYNEKLMELELGS